MFSKGSSPQIPYLGENQMPKTLLNLELTVLRQWCPSSTLYKPVPDFITYKWTIWICSENTVKSLHILLLVCLNGRLPKWRKWVSHYGFCLTSGNRTKVPTSLGRVNPNTAATGNRTRCMARHQAASGPRQIGIQSAPGGAQVCARPLVKTQV